MDAALEPSETDRFTGTAVHRLFQRQLRVDLSEAEVAALVTRVMRPEEFVDAGDVKRLTQAAAAMYMRIRTRDDVMKVLSDGTRYYELPFSWRPPDRPGVIVRGRIDCVVAGADGILTILEFKTGRPRPEHEAQLAMYRNALHAIVPDREIRTHLVYP